MRSGLLGIDGTRGNGVELRQRRGQEGITERLCLRAWNRLHVGTARSWDTEPPAGLSGAVWSQGLYAVILVGPSQPWIFHGCVIAERCYPKPFSFEQI